MPFTEGLVCLSNIEYLLCARHYFKGFLHFNFLRPCLGSSPQHLCWRHLCCKHFCHITNLQEGNFCHKKGKIMDWQVFVSFLVLFLHRWINVFKLVVSLVSCLHWWNSHSCPHFNTINLSHHNGLYNDKCRFGGGLKIISISINNGLLQEVVSYLKHTTLRGERDARASLRAWRWTHISHWRRTKVLYNLQNKISYLHSISMNLLYTTHFKGIQIYCTFQ